uniref:ParE toxin of type II toxin-antitoxin system, parDE n=1 Tax=Candidatus Kentrum sp. LPFa TaxID=2126335 RepID=A0A450WUV3_9GAMM|nr:MAG: hypothetical protein BECKLPF1236B_GA0070989_12273 [Candidatus Kentron sp. LPFa]
MSMVNFNPDARAEFLEAVKYYEVCQPGLGRRFRLAVKSELDRIREMPLGFRVLHAPFRRCLVRKFASSKKLQNQSPGQGMNNHQTLP